MTVTIRVAPRLRLIAVICAGLLTGCGGSSNGGYTGANTTGVTSSSSGPSGNTGSSGISGGSSSAGGSSSTGGSGSSGGSSTGGPSTGGSSGAGATATCGSINAGVGSSNSGPTAYILDVGNTYGNYSNTTTNACVIGYPLNASGTVNASVVVNLPDPGNSYYMTLATDSAGNLYVGSINGPLTPTSEGQVLVFAAKQSGTATPIRTITVPATQTSSGLPTAITVDGTGNIYVATTPNVTAAAAMIYEFPAGGSGNVAPIRTLSVSSTQGWGCQKLAVDGHGNLLCALEELGQILIFSSAQSGSATPARTISLRDSGAMVNEIVDFCLDPTGNIYIAGAVELHIGLPISILEYPGGVTATANANPISTISGDALPGNTIVSNIGLDREGNLYVNEYQLDGDTTVEPMVVRFAAGAGGFATPVVETLATFPNLFDPGVNGFSVN